MSPGARVLKRIKTAASDVRPAIQYRIQLVDESLVHEVASFLMEYFLPYENWFATLDVISDEKAVEEMEAIFKDLLMEELSLAAFMEDSQENRGSVIGCNVLNLERGNSSKIDCQSEKLRTIFQTKLDMQSQVDVLKLYSCSKYMHTRALTVVPAYARRGIATEILKAREEVCRMTDTPVCASTFTTDASMRAAAKCGYKTISELDLTTYRINGKIVYPSPKLKWPTVKWMAIRYF